MGHTTDSISNLAVLDGRVSSEPHLRTLADGHLVASFDMTTTTGDATISVPIAWHRPTPRALDAMSVDAQLVVIGSVRRRFFRTGGVTQSRTEVVADSVLPARRRAAIQTALRRVAASISERAG